ncbi:hypothetical protein HPB48_021923 [Haemaphysalis longicornis]|uniref:RING-type domain-containing protein n=1 Tax=Haemaphysalis longicornis TaxID=44386 RepID=A0A9J6FW93_HAELO|nr:hypothetical protein HPB48_021923 [Haemaphysalis longicornis]
MASAREGGDDCDAGETVRSLKGFGGFLTARSITFIDTPPSENACSVCNELVAEVSLIPCGHKLCELCREILLEHPLTRCRCDSPTTSSTSTSFDLCDSLTPLSISDSTSSPKCCKSPKARCPIDDIAFRCHCDYSVYLDTEPLMRSRVRCVNASEGCDFVGPLGDLEGHCLDECDYFVVVVDGRKMTRETRAEAMAMMIAAEIDPVVDGLVAQVEQSSRHMEEIMLEIEEYSAGCRETDKKRLVKKYCVDGYSVRLERDSVKTKSTCEAPQED